jgi:hypothetical protein
MAGKTPGKGAYAQKGTTSGAMAAPVPEIMDDPLYAIHC